MNNKPIPKREIPTILNEEDKKIIGIVTKEPENSNELILVHVTDFLPKNSIILTEKDGNMQMKIKVEINGQTHFINYKLTRETVHFAVNHHVESHGFGNWEDKKYAILIPYDSIPNEQIIGGSSVDIFTRGSVDIKRAYLLVPQEEREKAMKECPETTVIGYNGNRVLGYDNALIEMLGYKYEEGGMHSWSNKDADNKFKNILKQQNKYCYGHWGSSQEIKEKIELKTSINYI